MPTGITPNYTTSSVRTKEIGQSIDEMVNSAKTTRKGHERRWYDNNFFDDGFHFRYVSRQENKIIDLEANASIYNPIRTIPKASRQIRGVANLLVSNDLVPIVYPEKVISENYSTPEEFQQAQQMAKMVARKSGHWIEEEFKSQEVKEQIALMVLLAAKHSVSFMQIWPDAIEECIKTQVYDAFDIWLMGNYTELEDVPFIIKAAPKTVAEIKATKMFDQKQLEQIHPDNRHASSEIKQAYMQARYGTREQADSVATLIEKEAFVREYLDEENVKRIQEQEDAGEILKSRKMGDPVIRHTFTAGGVWLKDEYLDLRSYPFVDLRLEPGPIYSVPLIERFIPSNKSLDMLVSRIEKYAHTMGVGIWLKRSGEQFKISNVAGGQVVDYKSVPPRQMTLSEIPSFFFNYLGFLNQVIEEQGVSTTTLGKIPAGVKAAKAIESLKESEYANLVIANRRLQQTTRIIAEKFLDIADDTFVQPQTVYLLEKGEPQYFDVIGKSAIKKREDVGLETPQDVVPLSKEYRVEIEVQSGLGYTREGAKQAAVELGNFLMQLAQMGMVSPQVLQIFTEKLLETYQFGPTAEIMDALKAVEGQGNLSDQQIEAVKIAVAEALKDSGAVGPEAEEKMVDSTKLGVVEALKDAGLIDKNNSGGLEEEKVKQEMQLKQQKHEQDLVLKDDKSEMEKAKTLQEMSIKERQAQEDAQMKREAQEQRIKLAQKVAKQKKALKE